MRTIEYKGQKLTSETDPAILLEAIEWLSGHHDRLTKEINAFAEELRALRRTRDTAPSGSRELADLARIVFITAMMFGVWVTGFYIGQTGWGCL